MICLVLLSATGNADIGEGREVSRTTSTGLRDGERGATSVIEYVGLGAMTRNIISVNDSKCTTWRAAVEGSRTLRSSISVAGRRRDERQSTKGTKGG